MDVPDTCLVTIDIVSSTSDAWMTSSAWTSRNRSPTLTASWSRRSCRSASSSTMLLEVGRSAAASASERRRRGPLDGLLEPRRLDRLQQVVDRVHLERLDRVLVERGDEHDAAAPAAA